jgi:hypothetical protein
LLFWDARLYSSHRELSAELKIPRRQAVPRREGFGGDWTPVLLQRDINDRGDGKDSPT